MAFCLPSPSTTRGVACGQCLCEKGEWAVELILVLSLWSGYEEDSGQVSARLLVEL